MITVTILTKNSKDTIGAVLESVHTFDEILLLDTGSVDTTLDIARSYPNVVIHHSPFIGFGPLHHVAAKKATHDWILSIDSDEVMTQELVQEIQALSLHPKTTYSFPRHNYFNKKHIRWCGWYPDQVVRLYNRNHTTFTEDQVHERVETHSLRVLSLSAPVLHYSYHSISDFLKKMEQYTTLFAQQNAPKKRVSVTSALLRGWFAFFRAYILKRVCFGGREGLIISLYQAHTTFYKYLKLSL